MKKILFVGAEVMPFAATGGLGDVLGSLPAALSSGADVRVVMPLYSVIGEEWQSLMREEAFFDVGLSWRSLNCGVKSIRRGGVIYYFIDNEHYFRRNAIYGEYDDGERFAFFCMAVMEMMERIGFYPDILHANDWHSALCAVYLKLGYRGRAGYEKIKSVCTIHNIEYQGQFDHYILGDVFSLGAEHHAALDYNGCINLMKAAVDCADAVTTVSPKYAEEIKTPQFGRGLENILLRNADKLRGILNGIDYDYYNPSTDKGIAVNYSAASLGGKYRCRAALLRELGLTSERAEDDIPLLAIISRLVSHKGIGLICEIAHELLEQNDVRLVVLGVGEERYESSFRELQNRFPDKVRAVIGYDRELSRRIYAAADIFLMPSQSEPCGLSQMIASRYGAIPVVRETGGLYDSIKDYCEESGIVHGNGFTFANYSSQELKDRILAALALWYEPQKREAFVRKIMQTDFSWNASALKYMELYNCLTT